MYSLGAKIVTFDEFNEIRSQGNLGKVVATSGFFDPIHPGQRHRRRGLAGRKYF